MALPALAGILLPELIKVIGPAVADALKTDTAGQPPHEIEQKAESIATQLAVNLADAQSDGLFRAGWRPFIGWTCGLGLAASWIAFYLGYPPLPADALNPVLYGVLGLGAYRSVEKVVPAVVGKIARRR
jgi:hypothetical protein